MKLEIYLKYKKKAIIVFEISSKKEIAKFYESLMESDKYVHFHNIIFKKEDFNYAIVS